MVMTHGAAGTSPAARKGSGEKGCIAQVAA